VQQQKQQKQQQQMRQHHICAETFVMHTHSKVPVLNGYRLDVPSSMQVPFNSQSLVPLLQVSSEQRQAFCSGLPCRTRAPTAMSHLCCPNSVVCCCNRLCCCCCCCWLR
jgi:hypothetical protein